jgi:hypothetical protein
MVGRDWEEAEERSIMRWMARVLTCRLHQSRPALLPIAVLQQLEEKCACYEGGFERDKFETVGLAFDRLELWA